MPIVLLRKTQSLSTLHPDAGGAGIAAAWPLYHLISLVTNVAP